MDVKETILAEIRKVGEERNSPLAPLSDNMTLLDSGLDSLAFAVLVVRLEDVFGIDPFAAADEAPFPVTLRDFINCYENVVARS
jgi:acyl carrier protein